MDSALGIAEESTKTGGKFGSYFQTERRLNKAAQLPAAHILILRDHTKSQFHQLIRQWIAGRIHHQIFCTLVHRE